MSTNSVEELVRPKTADPKETQLLRALGENLRAIQDSAFEAGDKINDLKVTYGWSTKEIAEVFRFRQGRRQLDNFAAVALAIAPKDRVATLCFTAHLNAFKSAKRAASSVSKATGQLVVPDIRQALAVAVEVAMNTSPTSKVAAREMTRKVVAVERQKLEPKRQGVADVLAAKNRALIARMHHADNIDVMREIEPGTIRLAWLDPPYADYAKTGDGVLFPHASTAATQCSNNTRDAAMATTVSAIHEVVRLLRKHGVIVLWQASNGLPWQISKAIEEAGLRRHPFFVWDKGRAQMGNPACGTMYSTEVAYILTRRGEDHLGCRETRRDQVFCSPYQRVSASDFAIRHQMQKTSAVCAEVLERFTEPGDTVLDAFGCSASMSIEAEKMGRRWIYCELQADNYALGKRNMENYLLSLADAAA